MANNSPYNNLNETSPQTTTITFNGKTVGDTFTPPVSAMIENIKLKKELEEVRLDSVLKLPQRSAYDKYISELRTAPPQKDNDEQICIFFIDVDGLKQTNDNYGHTVGDRLLRHTKAYLEKNLRHSDIMFRVGGDELVIVATGNPAEIERKMRDLQMEIEQSTIHAEVAGNKKHIPVWGFSFGLHIYTPDLSDEENYHHADATMYRNKEQRKNEQSIKRDEQLNEMKKDRELQKNYTGTQNQPIPHPPLTP